MNQTTIRVNKSTVKRLALHGKYCDNMDEIINRLLDQVERKMN